MKAFASRGSRHDDLTFFGTTRTVPSYFEPAMSVAPDVSRTQILRETGEDSWSRRVAQCGRNFELRLLLSVMLGVALRLTERNGFKLPHARRYVVFADELRALCVRDVSPAADVKTS
jgi:hypothetical protein